ncbi:MAG TPA: LptF/LptG family permease [Isosphaeraceae bacterium]|jgi:lipopolysaccharide export system permease protein|nr:LptF/LptG family permease [Isosphaeraceae bacterium]
MLILDRERYWAFIKAYAICFISLIGLYIVIDAFTKLDEFTEVTTGTAELFKYMGHFYAIRLSVMFDQLCGVMTMMAAIFTVTWMQRNNELLAMLAAGLSTQRVIRPVIVSAVIVSGLAVANQECVLPRIGEELLRPPDDDGSRKVFVLGREDVNGILVHGKDGDRSAQTIMPTNISLPAAVCGKPVEIEAKQGRYIPDNDSTSPHHGGWLLRGAKLSPHDATLYDRYKMLLVPVSKEELKSFPPPVGGLDLGGDAYFLTTNLSFAAVTRDRHWFQFATTADLLIGLDDPANAPERTEISVFIHYRLLRPLLSLTLLCLSLPLVLGGDSRNMFINLGLSLGTSALFYGILFVSQFLGNNSVITPALAAWGPLIVFATLAVARWDSIRT